MHIGILATLGVLVTSVVTSAPAPASAQESAMPVLEAAGTERFAMGRATVYHSPGYAAWARLVATRANAMAGVLDDSLGLAFPFRVAVLEPAQWFTWSLEGGEVRWPNWQYGLPWAWPSDRLMVVPATLEAGPVIRDPADSAGNRVRLQFIALHELGHVYARAYFYPDSPERWSPVGWFEEFLATCFAYGALATLDPAGARLAITTIAGDASGVAPAYTDLDMMHAVFRELDPQQAGANYAWFQAQLNVQAAALLDGHGFALMRRLRELDWDRMATWSTDTVLAQMEHMAPGFAAWAADLGSTR